MARHAQKDKKSSRCFERKPKEFELDSCFNNGIINLPCFKYFILCGVLCILYFVLLCACLRLLALNASLAVGLYRRDQVRFYKYMSSSFGLRSACMTATITDTSNTVINIKSLTNRIKCSNQGFD